MEKNKDGKRLDELTLTELENLSEEELFAMDLLKGFVLPETVDLLRNPGLCPGGDIPFDKLYIDEEEFSSGLE